MMKNKGAGLIFTVVSVILTAASLGMYLVNCRTNYFATFGINPVVMGCLIAGILIQAAALVLCLKEQKPWMDLFPVASSAVLMAAAVNFLGSRINEFAFILTFQKSDNTLADMRSAVIGIALCLLAMAASWIASFFDITKEV